MKITLFRHLTAWIAVVLLLSACGAPTPDAAAIATSAVQTVEARYTEQVTPIPSETPIPTIADTSTPIPTVAVTPPTSTPQPLDSNGRPCYAAVFLADVSIPDGMIVAPGDVFTKIWRIQNNGNCVWDSTYSLTFVSGDAMGTVTSVPLKTSVYPDQSVDLAVDLTAPSTNGVYTGYWRILTPYGGTFGVGFHDQSLIVKINVTNKPNLEEGVAGIDIGLYQRTPAQGCNAKGAVYLFSATITANTAVNVTYHWTRNPDDESKPEGGRLNFPAAGSKTVTFTWSLQKEAIQDIDRWVALAIDKPNPQISQRIHFTFTCQQ